MTPLPAGWRSIVADFSHHQARVDFAKVRAAGVLAVVHKASQGAHYVDPRFAPRRDLARSVGLLYGGYHFATGEDPAEQAAHFLARLQPGDLAVLDVERNPSKKGTSMSLLDAEQFVRAIFRARGRWPLVYGGGDYLRDVLKPAADSILSACPLWWARYASTGGPGRLPAPWKQATIWQYTDGSHGPTPRTLDGVGPCDRDAFAGSDDALSALWPAPATG